MSKRRHKYVCGYKKGIVVFGNVYTSIIPLTGGAAKNMKRVLGENIVIYELVPLKEKKKK